MRDLSTEIEDVLVFLREKQCRLDGNTAEGPSL